MTKAAVSIVAMLAAALLGAACASTRKSESEREWARAECRQIIDSEARSKCLERVDKE
ncbi:MAG TPA: hypothetical protein VKR38_08735 [Usitatibacter sp.]|nr:hypothetical protein [Usitatibacter sp.]